jgi:integrase
MKVSILSSNGRLQLRFSYKGKREYLTLGLDDNQRNRKYAELKAKEIEADIIYGFFDESLAKYKPDYLAKKEQLENPYIICEKYLAYKKQFIAESSYSMYLSYLQTIQNIINQELTNSIDLKNNLLKNKSIGVAKTILTFLKSAYKWAIKEQLIKENPFEKIEITSKKTEKKVIPFTKDERDKIISYFEVNYPHYTGIVSFCFYTGCRPSEAVGLKWSDIKSNYILFSRNTTISRGKRITRNRLKTQLSREFPMNNKIFAILEKQKNFNPYMSDYVFIDKKGQQIHWVLLGRIWKSVL